MRQRANYLKKTGYYGLYLILLLLLIGCSQVNNSPSGNTSPSAKDNKTNVEGTSKMENTASRNNKYTQPPSMIIDAKKSYTATMETSMGTIKINLFADKTPLTVNNFVFLSKEGFYNGIRFHRIIKNFMIQSGDPAGNGTGGPGYRFKDELPPAKSYAPGIVAMANAGPNTNGSQFFICNGDGARNLNNYPNYTVFGEVTDGMDVVLAISDVKVGPGASGEMSSPTEDVLIKQITIEEK